MVEQIYELILEYKNRGNIYCYPIYYNFKHDRLNLRKIRFEDIRMNTESLMLCIMRSLRRSHHNFEDESWMLKSMVVDLGYSSFGKSNGYSKSSYYESIEELVSIEFLMKLKRGVYMVNPYMFNVLNMKQSSHMITRLNALSTL